jgi:hypothetical protein
MLSLLTGCAPTLKVEQYGKGSNEISQDEFPRQVAVVPFTNETEEPGLDVLVRRNFTNHFSSKSYLDVKLPIVDEKLIHLEKASGKAVKDATTQELAAALGVDGLLFGKVTDYKKVYTGVYSQLSVEAEVWLVNTKTGQELFRLRESVSYHEGGIPLSPLSVVVTVVSTAMNLRDIQKVRMVNELCYKFMEKIPSPTTMASVVGRPVIREVLTNAIDGPFGPKRVVKVGLQGDPGLVATYDLGSFKKGLSMKELQPGIYAGEYAVLPGDSTRDMPVTLTLTRPGGYETQWVDVSGFITIDTTPPQQVTGLRAKGYTDRIELTWDALKNVPDLKGYRVQRSESPLSGYTELALVEMAAYTDKTAVAESTYYYRIISEDQAGNRADITDSVRATLAGNEPHKLAGILQSDTTLDGTYLVTSTLVVPKGITLAIGGESRLIFAADTGLQVQGRLMVQGGDSPVEFAPSGEEKWSGIAVDGGVANLKRFTVRGAATGISSREGEILLENGIVSGCTTGIVISGITLAELKGMTVSGNTTGLKLSASRAHVFGSNILQNSDGILADGFSGEVRDNNLLDNEHNISSVKPLEVGANWFGTVRSDGLKLVNVSAAKVYDARFPGGTMVAPTVDPYAALNQEERQRKSTELLIEAGGYFRQRNFGKAAVLFSENLQLQPSAETYYYLGLCHQEMKESDKATNLLRDGTAKFPQDALLWKSLGMLAYEKGDDATAREALAEALRLSPDDSQARFVFERLKK